MPPAPQPRIPDTTSALPLQTSCDEADASGRIAVPRGIKRWSKWRQANLRAEQRVARQHLRSHHAESVDDAAGSRPSDGGSEPGAASGGGILPV